MKMAFWVTYDHLGKLILASLIWSLPLVIPAFIAFGAFQTRDVATQVVLGAPALVIALGLVLPVVTAGLCHMAKVLIEERDGSVGDMFRGMATYWRRAMGLGMLYLIVTACFGTSVWFYAVKLRESVPWLGYGISALALWALLFAGLTSVMALPTLVQKKDGVLKTVKLTALLVLDNPFLMCGIVLQLIGVTIVVVVLTPLVMFLYGALVCVLVSSIYELLARKYAIVGAAPEGEGIAQWKAAMAEEDEKDDYLNRGFRDFLFPWKG
ncbi:MAG: hypothetical protein GY851_13575 [bacterium]|nr:hypothetical protein [bacterium]